MRYLNSEEEERMIRYLIRTYNEEKSSIMEYSKFTQQTRIAESINEFESQLTSTNCVDECKMLKSVLLQNITKPNVIEISFKNVSKNVQKRIVDAFDLKLNNKLQIEKFINFVTGVF